METYLVIVDCFLSPDGGHVTVKPEAYWVHAANKRRAVLTTIRHVRSKHGSSLVKGHVVHAVAREQWGDAYFDTLHEEDYPDVT